MAYNYVVQGRLGACNPLLKPPERWNYRCMISGWPEILTIIGLHSCHARFSSTPMFRSPFMATANDLPLACSITSITFPGLFLPQYLQSSPGSFSLTSLILHILCLLLFPVMLSVSLAPGPPSPSNATKVCKLLPPTDMHNPDFFSSCKSCTVVCQRLGHPT